MHSLVCGNCSTDYNKEDHKPVVLGCGESVCEKCIIKCIEEKSTLVCPSCDEENESSNLSSFPINFTFLDLLNDNDAELRIITNRVRALELRKEQQKNVYNIINRYYTSNINILNNTYTNFLRHTQKIQLDNTQLEKENMNPNLLNRNINNKLNNNELKNCENNTFINKKPNILNKPQNVLMNKDLNATKVKEDVKDNKPSIENDTQESKQNMSAIEHNQSENANIPRINVLKQLRSNTGSLLVCKSNGKNENTHHGKLVLTNRMVHLHALQKITKSAGTASSCSLKFDEALDLMKTKHNLFAFIDFKINEDRQERVYIRFLKDKDSNMFLKYCLNCAQTKVDIRLTKSKITTAQCWEPTHDEDYIFYKLNELFGHVNEDYYFNEKEATEKPSIIKKLNVENKNDCIMINPSWIQHGYKYSGFDWYSNIYSKKEITRGLVTFENLLKFHLKPCYETSSQVPVGEVVQGLDFLDYLINVIPKKPHVWICDSGIATYL